MKSCAADLQDGRTWSSPVDSGRMPLTSVQLLARERLREASLERFVHAVWPEFQVLASPPRHRRSCRAHPKLNLVRIVEHQQKSSLSKMFVLSQCTRLLHRAQRALLVRVWSLGRDLRDDRHQVLSRTRWVLHMALLSKPRRRRPQCGDNVVLLDLGLQSKRSA